MSQSLVFLMSIGLTSGEQEIYKKFDQVVWNHFTSGCRVCLDNLKVLIFEKLIQLTFGCEQIALAEHDCSFVHLDNGLRSQLITVNQLISQHLDVELGFFLRSRSTLFHTALRLFKRFKRSLALTEHALSLCQILHDCELSLLGDPAFELLKHYLRVANSPLVISGLETEICQVEVHILDQGLILSFNPFDN